MTPEVRAEVRDVAATVVRLAHEVMDPRAIIAQIPDPYRPLRDTIGEIAEEMRCLPRP